MSVVSRERSAYSRRASNGIFCLEGDWWGDLSRSSTVKPVLKLLSQAGGKAVPYIHRDVGTIAELEHYVRKWSQKTFSGYPVLYLAFHGQEGAIWVGDRRKSEALVNLDQLAEWMGSGLRGRLVHLGSCGTMYTDKRNLRRFLVATGVNAVTGYRKEVDWLKSAAFETLLFDILIRSQSGRVLQKVNAEARGLAKELGFRIVLRSE
jgi:hypothetical protein